MSTKKDIWQFAWSRGVIYLTLFFTPLYFSSSHWFPFTTPKTLIIIGGTLLSAIFFLCGFIVQSEESIKLTPLHYVLFVFLLVMAVAGVFGIDPQTSFFGTFFSSVSIVLLWTLGVLATLIGEFVRRDFGFVKKIAGSMFFSGIVVAFISHLFTLGFNWWVFDVAESGSTIGNSSFAGTFLLFALASGFYILFTAQSWKKKIFTSAGILTILVSPLFLNAQLWRGVISVSDILHSPFILSGAAQGAQLGVVVFLLFSLSFWLIVSEKKAKKIIGATLLIIFAVGLGLSYASLLNPGSKVHQYFAEAKSGNRFVFWDIAKVAIERKPFLGYGFENYQKVYQQNFDPIIFKEGYAAEQWVSNPHNVVYDMAVSAGIIGLLAYMALLGFTCVAFLKFVKEKEKVAEKAMIVFAGVLVGYLAQNFFVFDTPTSFLVYFVYIGLAMGCLLRDMPENNITSSENSIVRKSIIFGGIGLSTICFVMLVILPWYESREWARLQSLPISDEYIALQEKIQHVSLMGGVDADSFYAASTIKVLDDIRKNLKPEEQTIFLREIDSLVVILSKDNQKFPNDFYIAYRAGTLMHMAFAVEPTRGTSYLDQARVFFDQAMSISPRNPRVYFNLAQNELFRGNKGAAASFVRVGMALGLQAEGEAFLERIEK